MRRFLLLAATAVVWGGCSCNDQTFVPIDESVLGDDYGKWLSMDVAADGSPIIAYYDVTYGGVGFAIGHVKTDGTVQWHHEQVDGFPDKTGLDTGDVGTFCSLKASPDGTIWLAYYGAGTLRVAHRVQGVWSWAVADGGSGMAPNVGMWASLALDSDNSPVVAEYDAANHALKVARLTDGTWGAETVATGADWTGTDATGAPITRPADVGQFARLHIEGSTEYLAFWDGAAQNLQLLEGFPGAYAQTTVYEETGGNVGEWPSILTTTDAGTGTGTGTTTLRIAFENRATGPDGHLMMATRVGTGNFTAETIDSDQYVGSDTEIFDNNGEPAILYFDGRNNNMKLATHDLNGWATETLGGDDDTAVGFFNEVAKAGGKTYAASYDYTNKTLFWKPLAL